ncbi:MAG: hypothetical protein J2O46_04645 [Nocardioides sp.]|nr:hypothetical protein [Nocardioides sp.]
MSGNPLSRRTALGLALAVPLGASGCAAARAASSPSPLPTAPAASAGSAPPNPDQPLVDRVIAALSADAGAPAEFRTLHAAHLKALGPASAPASAAPATDWKQHQRTVLTILTDAAVAARDPHLVTLLASCAASQRQLLHGRGLG